MKERLDLLLVRRGLAPSREKARTMIMEGNVFVNHNREDKAGSTFPEDCEIEIHGNPLRYVSRGGLKLEKAIKEFEIALDGQVCMDIGASTGGFTDCMLQNGAAKVFAVDVGYGQFAWKLRQDERVVCMEKTNIRYVTPEDIGEELDFASADVSFISLTKVLPPVRELLRDGARMVCLIKPQFEAGRDKVGKKGVVRDQNVHEEVIERVADFAGENGFEVMGLSYSPIRGPEGNIEYLLYIRKNVNGSREEKLVLTDDEISVKENEIDGAEGKVEETEKVSEPTERYISVQENETDGPEGKGEEVTEPTERATVLSGSHEAAERRESGGESQVDRLPYGFRKADIKKVVEAAHGELDRH